MEELEKVLNVLDYPLLVAVSNKEDIELSQVIRNKEDALKTLKHILWYYYECEWDDCRDIVSIKEIRKGKGWKLFELLGNEWGYPLKKYLLLFSLDFLKAPSPSDLAFLKNWGFDLE